MGEEYKISLGVDIDVDDIRTQIKDAENKVNPIKLNVEIENLNEIRQQLQNLGGTKGKAKLDIPINTQSIEQSLTRVADAVDDIKRSLGSLNSDSGMKNLLSSINQIATALGRAEDESQNLVNSLNALSKRDFSFNIGIDAGKKNMSTVGYGRAARKQVIPELEAQIQYLEKLHGGQQSAMTKLMKNKDIGFDVFTGFEDFNSESAIKKMEAMERYINSLKKLAAVDGIKLDGFNEEFSKSATEMINDITGLENAVDTAEDAAQRLKNIFGNGIDGGKLDEQLDSIVKDLGEIKNALVGLPDEQVDGLAQTFNKLSIALDKFIDNIGIVRTALGSGMSGSNVGGELASGIDNSMESIQISASETSGVITELKTTLQSMKLDRSSIDAITKDIEELGFEATDASVKMKNGNFDITVKGVDSVGRAVTEIRHLNSATGEITGVSRTISQSLKESDKFIKQQQRAVTDLTNQINQVNRAATDQNAARPIKDAAHLDSLKSKYDEIVAAIGRMGAASNDTFEDERNKVRTLISEYKSLKSEYKNAENVALQMDGNDFASGLEIAKNNLAKFKAEAQGFSQLTSTIKDLDTAIEGVGNVSSLKEFNNQLRVAKSKLSEVKVETKGLDEIKFGLTDKGAAGFKQIIASKQAQIDKLKKSTPELQAAMSRLNATMRDMDSANQVGDIQKLKVAYDNYKTALRQVDSQLVLHRQAEDNASKAASFDKAKEGALLRLKGLFSENSVAAKKFGSELDRIQRELNECSDTKGLTKINREITNLSRQVKNAGVQTQTFSERFKKQWQQYTSYFSVASIFSYGLQGLRSMFEQVKLIDSAMTELKKVTNETDEAYSKFLTNAASRSKEIGTTIDGLVSSTADFARLGYGFEDAQGLAEVANIYAVVGDEIEGVEQATESLISTMAAFKDQADGMSNSDFAMSIVDKFNEIGNNFAISSGGIGEALERSASALDAANNTLDESIALITAANTVVQDPEVVGTAFKTIAMRIRGAKTELEDAGLETEGMIESTATLRAEIEALSGVDIMEADGQTFKSTYAILDELAQKWDNLSDIQQATVTELIAGKRQGNIVSSLMTNFDTARDALETSLNSSGSAMQEHEKWQQSLEAQINRLKASWQSLSQAFLSSNFLHTALEAVIKLVDGLTFLIDKVGALPTLLGTVAAGMSIFKNKGLFTFDKDIKSIQLLGNNLLDLKDKYSQIQTAIGRYNSLSSKSADFQEKYQRAMANSNTSLGKYLSGLNGAKASFSGYIGSLVGATAKTIALEFATHALNAAITMGVSFAISAAIKLFNELIVTSEELAEKVDELTEKFRQEHGELKKLQSDYDTSNESSMISKYEKLSKGVDHLGRNVSLTADEYSEYQSIVNKIAEQIPSLVSGYDAQGNALLSVKGNVEELTAAYEKLIHAQNQEILTNTKDIEKNFANTVKKSKDQGFVAGWNRNLESDSIGILEDLLSGKNLTAEELKKLYGNDRLNSVEIKNALEDAGVDFGYTGIFSSWDSGNNDIVWEKLAETMESDPSKIKGIVDNYYAQFAEAIEKQKTIAQAKLSEAFDVSSAISGLDYGNISEDLRAVAYQIVNDLDFDDLQKLTEQGISVEDWVTNMLDQLNSIDGDKSAEISAAFDLQTKFNGGEISYGEYVQGLENTGKLIDGLGLDAEIESQLKLSIGLDEDGFVEGYKKLKTRLAEEDYFDTMPSQTQPFLESLSAEEVSVLWKVIPELEATEYKENIADIKSALELEMMLQGLNFDLNIEVEAAGLEALNTALAESVSATGLSSESIDALKGRYSDLESHGYDLSSMFEETSTGIRLNRQEFNKLENAYATEKLAEVDGELTQMKATYDDLGEAIKNCDDPVRKSELFNDRQTLAKRISEAATLAHQYKGLTNAYNDWLSAEEAGQERDMYENVIKGFETIDDEISRGWIDDSAIEFLELLTGRTDLAGKSGKQLKEIYDGLDDTIKNTGYSVRDFFTVDEDGNSTNTGVYNFLDAIGQLEEEKFGGKDIVKRDKDGNIISFDFELAGGDEAIAEALGVSEELVQIMIRAADDAGFVVSMDGTYKQLADLQNEAKAAADYLHQIGKTDFEFDFNTSSVENLKTQLEEAHKILDDKKFWNKDGTFNFNADGATQAMQVVSTLQAKLDKLTEDKYGIGLTVEDEEFEEPLKNLQDYGRKVTTLNQLELNPKANSEEIKELNGELNEIAEYFANLDKDTKVELGFEADDGIEDVKKKIESGEVKIPTVLDIQANMDKNIETLADLALLNSGLLSENEEETIRKKYSIEVEADEVDTSDVEDKVEGAVIDGLGNPILSREANIEIIAETFGIEDVDDLSSKLEGLDDKTIQAIAEAVGKGDVDALQIAVDGMDGNTVQAVAEALGYSDVETLKAAVRNMQGNEVDAKVNTEGQSDKIATLQSEIDGLDGKTVNIWVGIKRLASSLWGYVTGNKGSTRNDSNGYGGGSGHGGGRVNGSANVNGTTGRAFARGDWRTKKTETALTGELGREIVVTPDNYWYTVGDTGAEFATIPKGSIVFNHRQTEELFRNGKVTSDGGRGKAFADGTAFSRGSGGIGKVAVAVKDGGGKTTTKTTTKKKKDTTTTTTTTTTSSGGSSGSDGGSGKADGSAVGSKDKFEETFDWVAIAIERIEREIDNLDKIVGSTYQSWSKRNDALTDELEKIAEERQLQIKAYREYMYEANNVKLDESWKKKVREGEIDIETITDESIAEKVKEYQDFYNKAMDCQDALTDLRETEAALYAQRFENIQSQYDGILQGYEHTETMLNEYISQAEAKGHIVSKEYYEALIANEKQNINALKQEQADLIKARDEAVASGKITKYSEEWYNMCAEIDSVTQSIEEGNTALVEYANAIRDIDWQVFDLIQERISDVTAEVDFLIDLMSNKKLYDDNGKLTEQGMATIGLHGQNYNTYMYAADEYAKEIAELDKQIAKDKYDQELINRRQELIELQRESILAAEDEKNAIRDMVEESINLELDALQELIDKKNEALESERDLYEYQKKVKEQTKEIASLEKQMAAFSADDSEEAKAKVQELMVSLEEARTDLQESEYDKYISDQSALLDELYLEYENILNARLDNVDALLAQVIDAINIAAGAEGTIATALGSEGAIAKALASNGATIKTTLETEAKGVGTTLSTAMKGIWSVDEGNAKSVLTEYGKGFQDKQTTTNTVLSDIKAYINRMVDDVDKEADKNVNNGGTKSSSTVNQTKASNPPKTEEPKKEDKKVTEDTIKGVAAAIWIQGKNSGWGNNPFRENKLAKKLGKENALKVQQYINKYGASGELYKFGLAKNFKLDKYQYSAFATGARKIDENQYAWTQEQGQEYIVRPSDGAILTPVAKGDSVLTSAASNNIWNMANSPAEFIKDNLRLDASNVPNNSTVQSNYTQYLDKVVFNLPNVKNYNELLTEMQRDPKFEKLILSMTVDQLAGKSSLSKGKSIR